MLFSGAGGRAACAPLMPPAANNRPTHSPATLLIYAGDRTILFMIETPVAGFVACRRQYIGSECGSPVAETPAIVNAAFDQAKQCGDMPGAAPAPIKSVPAGRRISTDNPSGIHMGNSNDNRGNNRVDNNKVRQSRSRTGRYAPRTIPGPGPGSSAPQGRRERPRKPRERPPRLTKNA